MLQVVFWSRWSGGLVYGHNLVSFGFAAILLGLSVDYGLVLYQDLATGETSVRETGGRTRGNLGFRGDNRGRLALLNSGPRVWASSVRSWRWVTLAAVVMLWLPPLAAHRLTVRPARASPLPAQGRGLGGGGVGAWPPSMALGLTGLLLPVCGWLVLTWFPVVDHTTQPLSRATARPSLCCGNQRTVSPRGVSVMLLLSGRDSRGAGHYVPMTFGGRAAAALVKDFELPLAPWPNPMAAATSSRTGVGRAG
jgi:hypothetical protein